MARIFQNCTHITMFLMSFIEACTGSTEKERRHYLLYLVFLILSVCTNKASLPLPLSPSLSLSPSLTPSPSPLSLPLPPSLSLPPLLPSLSLPFSHSLSCVCSENRPTSRLVEGTDRDAIDLNLSYCMTQ